MVSYQIHDVALRLAVHNAKLAPPVFETPEGKKKVEETAEAIGISREKLVDFYCDIARMTPPATW